MKHIPKFEGLSGRSNKDLCPFWR